MQYIIVPPGMMIPPAVNCGSRSLNFSLTARASADLKGPTFQLLYLILRVVGLGAGFEHRWELPVIRYHSIRGNYHYPFLGVLFSVILHDFIRQNYHKNQSDPYPFPLITVNYPIFPINYHNLYFQMYYQYLFFSKNTRTMYQNKFKILWFLE